MKVSAILPTIDGREELLDQTIESLSETANGFDVELLVVKNCPTIGEAWNKGAEQATGTHLWLAADDVTMQPGWLEAAVEFANEGGYPCPRIIRPDGSIEACGTVGQSGCILSEVEDGFLCACSQFPFVLRETWEEIGPCIPVAYFADDYLGYRARKAGLEVRLVRAYTLIHHEGIVGRREHVQKHWRYREMFLEAIAEEARWHDPLHQVAGQVPA